MVSLIKICEHDLVETSALGDPYRTWWCPACDEIVLTDDAGKKI
jgi:hypothetical protein